MELGKEAMVHDREEGPPCSTCGELCPGFNSHSWRNTCTNCHCVKEVHQVKPKNVFVEQRLGWMQYDKNKEEAKNYGFAWMPPSLSLEKVEEYMDQLPNHKIPKLGTSGELNRFKQIVVQLPQQDLSIEYCNSLVTDSEKKAFEDFVKNRDECCLDIGYVQEKLHEDMTCHTCEGEIEAGDMAVLASKVSDKTCWHPACFCCSVCEELLVDLVYCHLDGKVFCERHFAEQGRTRCKACDELIFSGEYTKAMDENFHNEHFGCFNCDKSLTGHRYILREEQPYCIGCFDQKFAKTCEECQKPIGADFKDLSYKDRHWHESCFKCFDCQNSLVDQPFATKEDRLYCADCYDKNFAPVCDECNDLFRAGMKKFEYKGRQYHEACFTCLVCKNPIGNQKFIPRDSDVVCVPCFEKQFAQKCKKCDGVINKGGVTYKGDSFHRECFTCNNCNKELHGQKFTSKDDQPHCADCFGELFAKKCCRCSGPISGISGGTKYISFEDRHWHSECFVCYKCDASMVGRGFLTNGGEIMCPECGKN